MTASLTLLLVHKRADQAVFADQIHHTWNTIRITMDGHQRFRIENLASTRSCNTQPLAYVSLGLLKRQRMRFGAQRQPLTQLPQLGLLKFLLQLRLADQNNL